jgi:nucleotide-binding universal stress UspA family protein
MIQNLKKIMAPIDFSEYSMEALRGEVELAKDLDGEVHIFLSARLFHLMIVFGN